MRLNFESFQAHLYIRKSRERGREGARERDREKERYKLQGEFLMPKPKLIFHFSVPYVPKVMAPEPSLKTGRHLKDVIKLIIGLLADLTDTSSPLF